MASWLDERTLHISHPTNTAVWYSCEQPIMNIRENLINSKQSALVVKAILIATFISLILVAVNWYQLDEYKSEFKITDKAAYNLCVDKEVEKLKSRGLKSDGIEILAQIECSVPWLVKKSVKIEKPSFQSYILKKIDQALILIAVMAAGIYFIIFTYIFYARCNFSIFHHSIPSPTSDDHNVLKNHFPNEY